MATRSTIALEYADGTVDQIYCHWDGYIEHNGQILERDYKDPFKVQKLMDLGDLSALGSEIGEKQDFDDHTTQDDDWCLFYARDRGEWNVDARRFSNYEDYLENRQREEFDYILQTDGVWRVSIHGNEFVELANAVRMTEIV